ncbi:hypothetical protein ACFRJ3_12790 [Streptomyces sp. NPDC056696]|uniref:hypothetical protein n=1 Tax=unclassified Streptomyces TaxID=2593676 RepID=UPI0036B5A246
MSNNTVDARHYRMVVNSLTDYVRTGALIDEQLCHCLAQPTKRFKQWCEDAPEGTHVISPRKVVRDESKSVKANGDWSRARRFPVPRHVCPDGKLFMGAHLRIGGGNTIAPRLHHYDGVCTDHGIFVDYMGPRLANIMT